MLCSPLPNRAASQLGDSATLMTGPGLAPDTTVSDYMRTVWTYDFDFRWQALAIVASYCIGFMLVGVCFQRSVSWLRR